MVLRKKGDRYRPVVKIHKVKKEVPTVIEVSGQMYSIMHPSHAEAHKKLRKWGKRT